jgi:hydroxymethylpyrimidine/phosphomethylpyrimidine kinase
MAVNEEITKGINVLMSHYPVSVVKIGIVKDAEFLGEIIKAVKICNSDAKIVWDPVLKYLRICFFQSGNTSGAEKYTG